MDAVCVSGGGCRVDRCVRGVEEAVCAHGNLLRVQEESDCR